MRPPASGSAGGCMNESSRRVSEPKAPPPLTCRGQERAEIRFHQSLIEGRQISLQDLLEVHLNARPLALEGFQRLELSLGGCEIGSARHIAATGADLGVEPDEIEIDSVGLDEVFVVTVAQRP